MRSERHSVLQALDRKIKAARGSSRLGIKGVARSVGVTRWQSKGGRELSSPQSRWNLHLYHKCCWIQNSSLEASPSSLDPTPLTYGESPKECSFTYLSSPMWSFLMCSFIGLLHLYFRKSATGKDELNAHYLSLSKLSSCWFIIQLPGRLGWDASTEQLVLGEKVFLIIQHT